MSRHGGLQPENLTPIANVYAVHPRAGYGRPPGTRTLPSTMPAENRHLNGPIDLAPSTLPREDPADCYWQEPQTSAKHLSSPVHKSYSASLIDCATSLVSRPDHPSVPNFNSVARAVIYVFVHRPPGGSRPPALLHPASEVRPYNPKALVPRQASACKCGESNLTNARLASRIPMPGTTELVETSSSPLFVNLVRIVHWRTISYAHDAV